MWSSVREKWSLLLACCLFPGCSRMQWKDSTCSASAREKSWLLGTSSFLCTKPHPTSSNLRQLPGIFPCDYRKDSQNSSQQLVPEPIVHMSLATFPSHAERFHPELSTSKSQYSFQRRWVSLPPFFLWKGWCTQKVIAAGCLEILEA